VCADEDIAVEAEESLVRLVESPTTDAESTSAAVTSTRPSLQLRLMSCQSCDSFRSHRDTVPQLCGYYFAVSGPSSSRQPPQTEDVDTSNDSTDDVDDCHLHVHLSDETDTQPSAEATSNTSSSINSLAAETVVKSTAAAMSDVEMSGESHVQTATDTTTATTADDTASTSHLSSSLPGTRSHLFELITSTLC